LAKVAATDRATNNNSIEIKYPEFRFFENYPDANIDFYLPGSMDNAISFFMQKGNE
jgi:hypothetical protein